MGYRQEYELLEVAHFWRMQWGDFDQLDVDDQALLIAHYETRRRFEAVDFWQNRPEDVGPKASRNNRRSRRRR
jgi:hypothetical protein